MIWRIFFFLGTTTDGTLDYDVSGTPANGAKQRLATLATDLTNIRTDIGRAEPIETGKLMFSPIWRKNQFHEIF